MSIRNRITEMRKDDRGFTLIELLLVIIILGVLAGIVVFSVSQINERGTRAACQADLKSIEVAQEAKFAKDKAYAASVDALKTAGYIKNPSTNTEYTITTNATGAVTATPGCGTLGE